MKLKLLECDIPLAHTGRIYPKSVMEQAVNAYRERIKNGEGALGDLRDDQLELSLEDASHKVTDIYLDGNDVMVELDALDTPAGQILQTSIGSFEITPVGVGTLSSDNQVENYELSKTSFHPKTYRPSRLQARKIQDDL